MSMDRRSVLRAALVSPFAGLLALYEQSAVAAPSHSLRALQPVADLRDGAVRLHLPPSFSYRSFHDTESTVVLSDGTQLPGRHDGMGAFAGPGGRVRLVRNHELGGVGSAFGPVGEHTYDPMAPGGVTVVDVTLRGDVLDSWTALNGTVSNCSGGRMPCENWVTCEETITGPDVGPDYSGSPNTGFTQRHGCIFGVPTSTRASAEPVTRAGRFCHEAVSLDPEAGYLYLTEDNFAFPSGFYRYRPGRHPVRHGQIDNRSSLQMLAVKGEPNAHLEASQKRGATYDVSLGRHRRPGRQVPVHPGAGSTDVQRGSPRLRREAGPRAQPTSPAWSDRFTTRGSCNLTSTQGGGEAMSEPDFWTGYGRGTGQVWAYDTRPQRLRLVYESPSKQVFDFPDNITTSRRRTLVVCEYGTEDNYLRGLTHRGKSWDIALNRVQSARTGKPRYDDEFAGSTFSPDGSTLFVNIQASAGLTFAICGDWNRLGV
jgi:uncharacterized protein